MSALMMVLVFVCILSIIIGLVKPGAVLRWGKQKKRGRGSVLLLYGSALIVLMIGLGITSEDPETLQVSASQEENRVTEAADTVPEELKHPEWNTDEPDAMENGNVGMAIDMLKTMEVIPQGELAIPGEVIKAPWSYYGTPLIFSGVVAIAEDYPPGSDTGKAGVASDIVIESDDGTIVEFFCMVPSGAIKAGDVVNITGYPVGRTEVENQLGGSFTHLVVVTNHLENIEGDGSL